MKNSDVLALIETNREAFDQALEAFYKDAYTDSNPWLWHYLTIDGKGGFGDMTETNGTTSWRDADFTVLMVVQAAGGEAVTEEQWEANGTDFLADTADQLIQDLTVAASYED